MAVRSVERIANLAKRRKRPLEVQRLFSSKQLAEIHTVYIAHGEIQQVVGVASLVDRNDVRVLDRSCEL